MSPSTQDRTLLACAGGLFVTGLVAWWLLPPGAPRMDPGIGSLLAVWLSGLGLASGVWRLSQPLPRMQSRFVAALALAATASLSAVPMVAWPDPWVAGAGFTVAALAVVPLALALADRVPQDGHARRVRSIAVGCVVGSVLAGWLTVVMTDRQDLVAPALARPGLGLALRSLLVTVALALPAGFAASWALRDPQAGSAQRRILVALGLGAAATVPVVTGIALLTPAWQVLAVPLFAAATMAVILARVAIRPLARAAGTAIVQRDLVVAAAEAERNRLASALHDGPLGDITLLVQQLDQAGDTDNAAIARSIATDLRSIGNDLQLPILDDLGAGPALEWLVDRLSRRSGAEVLLQVETHARPPARVELAIYRIAQEALVNAIKHGHPPVTVRYASEPDLVSLSVDDAGPGLDREAPARAQREGRLGLLSMSLRAESIGARLVLAAPPSGGTHVGLDWRPAAG